MNKQILVKYLCVGIALRWKTEFDGKMDCDDAHKYIFMLLRAFLVAPCFVALDL